MNALVKNNLNLNTILLLVIGAVITTAVHRIDHVLTAVTQLEQANHEVLKRLEMIENRLDRDELILFNSKQYGKP